MSEDILRYSSNLDKKVIPAFESALGIKAKSASKIKKGEVNHVYKVDTTTGSFILRVFRQPDWPEKDKPMWIEKKLVEANVPHAIILFHTRDNEIFPYGFMISEYIEGLNGWDAIGSGQLSFKEFQELLSPSLAKIHQININAYGSIRKGKGHYSSFTQSKLKKLTDVWQELEEIETWDKKIYNKVCKLTKNHLTSLEDRFHPVLNHGDAGPDNSIVTPEGEVILIDWDGARSNIWFADYALMMYWVSVPGSDGEKENRAQQVFESNEEIITCKDFTQDELWQLAKTLQILEAINLLPYYYFNQKNPKAYRETKQRLMSLLT